MTMAKIASYPCIKKLYSIELNNLESIHTYSFYCKAKLLRKPKEIKVAIQR